MILRTIRKYFWLLLAGLVGLGLGTAFSQATKPAVSITNEIAWFKIDGSRLVGVATKRMTFVSLHYNDVSVPCILVDTHAGALSNDTIGGATISCGWNEKAIETLGQVGK